MTGSFRRIFTLNHEYDSMMIWSFSFEAEKLSLPSNLTLSITRFSWLTAFSPDSKRNMKNKVFLTRYFCSPKDTQGCLLIKHKDTILVLIFTVKLNLFIWKPKWRKVITFIQKNEVNLINRSPVRFVASRLPTKKWTDRKNRSFLLVPNPDR